MEGTREDIIDLTFVKQAQEEHPRYLCPLCVPDAVLFEVTDPAKLEFVGEHTRYECPSCGYLIDDVDPRIRTQEQISTILGDARKSTPPQPIIEPVARKEELRGTAHSRIEEVSYDLDKSDTEALRHQGMQIQREEVKSSVSGRRTIRKHELPRNRNRHI